MYLSGNLLIMHSEAKQDFTLFHALNVQPYTKDVRPAVIGVLLDLCHKQRYFKAGKYHGTTKMYHRKYTCMYIVG